MIYTLGSIFFRLMIMWANCISSLAMGINSSETGRLPDQFLHFAKCNSKATLPYRPNMYKLGLLGALKLATILTLVLQSYICNTYFSIHYANFGM